MFIDIGNTNVKILDDKGNIRTVPTKTFNAKDLGDESSGDVVIASVVPEVLSKINRKYTLIGVNAKFSFNHSLEGVGVDRLLAVEGILTEYDAPFVVIDAGTAITVDFVSLRGNEPCLEGGLIIPGLSMALNALNDNTSKLPKLEPEMPTDIIGKNTKQAMLSGVCNTIVKGIDALIDETKFKRVFVTGGDGHLFKELSSKNLVFVDELVFLGMKSVCKREKGK